MVDDFVFGPVTNRNGSFDVLFIHGLTGDPLATWSNKESKEPDGTFWPKWIAADVQNANVYTLGYPASLFARWAQKEMSLHEQAIETLDRLAGYRFGKLPIAIVAHSLGGLLTKQLLRTGLEANDSGWKAVAEAVRRVVFLATPHTGSSLANILSFFVSDLSSSFVTSLRRGSDLLDDLNNSYRSISERQKIVTVTYYEKHKTARLAFVVEKGDADCGISVPIPVAANHIEISKPIDRSAQVYRGVLRQLLEVDPEGRLTAGLPKPGKMERDDKVVRDLVHKSSEEWLKDRAGPVDAAAISSKMESGVFAALSEGRKKGLAGIWAGTARQDIGPDGVPIEYAVFLDLRWSGDRAIGEYRFTWSKAGTALVDETLPVEGGFYDGFLLLNFQDTVSGKLQFGSLYLQLSGDGAELSGRDIGVGYKTKKIVTGDVVFRRSK